MSMFFPPAVMRLSPAAYYGLLSNVRMVWDPDTRVVTYFRQPFSWSDLSLLLAATAVLYGWEMCIRDRFRNDQRGIIAMKRMLLSALLGMVLACIMPAALASGLNNYFRCV